MMMVIVIVIMMKIPVLVRYKISLITSNAGKKLKAISGRLLRPVNETHAKYTSINTPPII